MRSGRDLGQVQVRADRSFVARRIVLPAQRFIHAEETAGAVLMASAIAAVIWANSPLADLYHRLWELRAGFAIAGFSISMDLHHWINDALMALFFFMIGLEIKRELLYGELASVRSASLPIAAAAGGMVVPAAIYLALNSGTPEARGWGIPMATDIAFALGVLALLRGLVSTSVRILLLAVATVDDIGAILVIALFYTDDLSLKAIGAGVCLFVVILVLWRAGVSDATVHTLLAIAFWAAILKSGVHATIAGVILGLCIPARAPCSHESFLESLDGLAAQFRQAREHPEPETENVILGQIDQLAESTESPLERLERSVHPWVTFLVLPLFALANAGISLSGASLGAALSSPVSHGVFLGLTVGKVVGILLFSWIAIRSGLGSMSSNVGWNGLVGVGLLGGIGFTVSIFITGLAFRDPASVESAKAAIFAASILAGILGFLYLRMTANRRLTRG